MKNWIDETKLIFHSKYFLLFILFFLFIEPTIQLWAMRNTDNETRNWILPAICALCLIAICITYRVIKCKALISGRSFWTAFSLSILFNLTLNRELVQQTHQIANALLLSMGLMLASYGILRRFCFLLWMPLIFILTVKYAASSMYGISLNASTLAQVFNATADEIFVYLTYLNCFLIILLLGGISLCCYFIYKGLHKEHSLTLFSSAVFCFAALYISRYYMQPVYYNQDCGLWPIKELRSIGHQAMQGVKENEEIRNMVYALPSAADKPSHSTVLQGNEGVTIVLHIGESVTSDHLASHGYNRNTMPFVQSMSNIIHFKDCTASSIYTVYSMVTILTDGRRGYNICKDENMKPTVSSFADLLVKHSFKQYCLFSHGTMIHTAGQNTLPKILQKLTNKATATYSNTGLPMKQIPQLQKILKEDPKSNKLILINNEGSHAAFTFYDLSTAPYHPTGLGNQSSPSESEDDRKKRIINDYDNTIHYTDQYIKKATDSLKGTPFVYIYISDHGEYLGENDRWNRTAGDSADYFYISQGCRVPFFIIYSPELQKLHPHFSSCIDTLRKNAHLSTAHEHIFHTILGIAGIQSPHYKAELDLSSPHAKQYTDSQPLNKSTNYETRVDHHQGIQGYHLR